MSVRRTDVVDARCFKSDSEPELQFDRDSSMLLGRK